MSLHTQTTWRRRFHDRFTSLPTRPRPHRGVLGCEALEERRVPASLAPLTLAPADYNGDGHSEIAVFQPETSTFFIKGLDGATGNRAIQFGQGSLYGGNPVPVVADFNHDGVTELAVFQPSNSTFYIRHLNSDTNAGNVAVQFGQGTLWGGSPVPVVADYNGDGMAELSVYQPTTSTFSIRHLTGSTEADNRAIQFGQGTFDGGHPVPVVADYNDDGKAEVAVYQPTTSTFAIQGLTANSAAGNRLIQFGRGSNSGGSPVPAVADTNNDGKVELIVYQTSSSVYQMANLVGDQPMATTAVQFGQGTLDGGNPIPVCTDLDGDGKCELTVYQPKTSTYYVKGLMVNGVPTNRAIQFGQGILYGGRPTALPAMPVV